MSNMELWVRSQDRKILQKVNKLYVATFSEKQGFGIYDLRYDDLEDIDDTDVPLGFYKSKERVLEVLDEIQNKLLKSKYDKSSEDYGKHSNCKDTLIEISSSNYVYQMPID